LSIGEQKAQLRKIILKRRNELTATEVEQKSAAIASKLFNLDFFKEAKTVMFYCSMPGEVDTKSMIRKALNLGKRVFLPCINEKSKTLKALEFNVSSDVLEKGPYGIYQPKQNAKKRSAVKHFDIVFVPAIAFDESGYRIGFGHGYYDRFLATNNFAVSVGLAYSFAVVEFVPREYFDVSVNVLLTEEKVVSVTRSLQ